MRTLLPLLLVAPLLAQEEPLEGHSAHGQVFNEGPRQAAYLVADSYNVDFPVTVAGEEARRFFQQGVAFLHGFWYFEAERTFRHVADLDPDCAMAYWGMAMANVDNEDRAAGFARVAWLKRGLATPRERAYIDALARFHEVEGPQPPERLEELEDEEEAAKRAEELEDRKQARAERLVKDYEEIVWDHPDDLEAKAFLVNRIWLNRRLGIPTTSRQAVESLVQEVLTANPDHPAHHYRIHLWDADDTAERVVDSALASGPSLPQVAHMWHMGGHIFARLGRHSDAAWQQEASARVDHAQMIRDWVLPDQIHNFAHNNEWLTRSLRHHGRMREAVSLAKNMIELPRHPRFNMLDRRGCSASYGRRRLLEALALFERWGELVRLSRTMYLEPAEQADDRADRAYVLARAHAHRGDWAGFEAQRAELERALEEGKRERVAALEEAEEQALADEEPAEEVRAAMTAVLEEHQRGLDDMRDQLAALDALRTVLEANVVFVEDVELLEEHGFDPGLVARLYLEAGEPEKAIEAAREAADDHGKVVPHANLAYALWEAGEREEALEVFDEVRAWTARADLDVPPLARLAPLAAARGLPADWRPEPRLADDIPPEARPDLDTLGTLRWTPPRAPGWTLPDGFGGEVSLADYRGEPVIVIFFLGFGCVHCVEQLVAFAPEYERFQEAGIELVAIGTDSVEELAASQADRGPDEAYPFPILSDASLDLFREYRAHDDFEDVPLHGTYLIDGEGRVRWIDVSWEPFMDHEFLLAESVRLLGLPEPSAALPEPVSVEVPAEGAGAGGQE